LIMNISMVVVVFFVMGVPIIVEAVGGRGKGKETMIVFDQLVLDRGVAVMRTRMHVGYPLMRRPVVGDLVYAAVGRTTTRMLAGEEGIVTPFMLPGSIAEIRQPGGLFPGETTFLIDWNDGSVQDRHVNMQMVFYRNEAVQGDIVQVAAASAVAATAATAGGATAGGAAAGGAAGGGAAGGGGAGAGNGTDNIVGLPYEIGTRSSRCERDLVLQLNSTTFELRDAKIELATTLLVLKNAESRCNALEVTSQLLRSEHQDLRAENQRLTAELNTLRASNSSTTVLDAAVIASSDSDTHMAEEAANDAGHIAHMADDVADAAATAVGTAGAVVAAADVLDPDPTTHDEKTTKRKRNQRMLLNPPKIMHGKLPDWKDSDDNCGGTRA